MRTPAAGTFRFDTRQTHGFPRYMGQRCSVSRASKVPSQSSSNNGPVVLVDGLVVQPAYRSTPWDAERKYGSADRDKALIMFVSESGICRAPIAAALFQQQLQQSPLRDWIAVQQRATRDYCLGDAPTPSAVAAAAALGTQLATAVGAAVGTTESNATASATLFDPANDIVAADLVLVMDKYTAADVLREVSSYDLINPGGQYSARVRLLGSYHPQLAAQADQTDGQDIDDPLYGNVGGEEEQAAVLEIAQLLQESCSCLLQQLEQVAEVNGLLQGLAGTAASEEGSMQHDNSKDGSASEAAVAVSAGARFREVLIKHVREEGTISWLVPPMLQGSHTDLGGWV